MPRKLSDEDLAAIHDRFCGGETTAKLAEDFGVSERHVRRLVEGIEPAPPRLSVEPNETVQHALRRFLEQIDGDAADGVRIAAALALASRLDHADSRAAPALAKGLIDLLGELSGLDAEPDAIELLRRRSEARRLAMVAQHAGGDAA